MANQQLPARMQLIAHSDHIEIIRAWRGPIAFFLVFFTGFWWFILMQFIPMIPTDLSFDKPFLYLPLLHVVAGIFVAYFTVAFLLNKTHIYANQSTLEITHTPLPWCGNRVMESSQIAQFYTKQITHRGKHGISYSYQLRAKLRDQSDIKILSGLQNPEQAIFVEEQLEDRLNIKNAPVRGEY